MARYQQQITNPYTNETYLITSNDLYILEQKANTKLASWDKQHERDEKRLKKESLREQSVEMTTQDKDNIQYMANILADTLAINDVLEWESLKDNTAFKKYKAVTKPIIEDFFTNVPKPSFLEILPAIKQKRIDAETQATQDYESKLKEWEATEANNKKQYEKEKYDYLEKQTVYNQSIDADKKLYENLEVAGVEKYFSLVLEKSKYPDFISLSHDIGYSVDQKLIIVDVKLPNFDDIPYIKEHKYISSKNTIEEVYYSNKEQEKIYNGLIYQIILRTIHEIFESDYKNNVEMVVVNGWVSGIDKKTGSDFNNCIATVQVTEEEFKNIHLDKIDPMECFKHLKGKSAGSLINLAPVPPIMKLDKTDKRIISAESVLQTLDQSTNLASMEWQDFEVLIRDLLKHEFSNENCKVEVTRASRDAGVDAIAFDEDPIRGGKYVIQAKRYNNIVPLSAVRDLYGTVMNEGAVKGILVTTSYYGKDALEFVKDKPLKLINGEELVYMFNKHGYNMKIELAKKRKAQSKINY